MAMQTGLGLSRILIFVGAGYTGSIVIRNGRLSDLLTELQAFLNDRSGDGDSTETEHMDALSTQVRRLALEVRQLATSRPVTVFNGGDSSQFGNATSLVLPAAALGALGYGYMWWKGLSFKDLMYVTKRNMAIAVESLTKNLDQLCDAITAAKRLMSKRIENLEGKVGKQFELSKSVQNEVNNVRDDISLLAYNIGTLRKDFHGLDERMCSVEEKQDFANAVLWDVGEFIGGKFEALPENLKHLANTGVLDVGEFIDGKYGALPENLKALPNPNNTRRLLAFDESKSLKGLKQITSNLESRIVGRSKSDVVIKCDGDGLLRTASAKC